MDWLNEIDYSHWWMLAGVLLLLELSTRVFFFLWLSFAAAAVGFLLLVFPSIPLLTQAVLFGLLSLVAAVAWRRQVLARQRAAQAEAAIGGNRLLTLEQPIVDGKGVLTVDGSEWRLTGPDLPAGARVRVVSVVGDTLTVEAAEAG